MKSHIQQKPDTTASEGGSDRTHSARDRIRERRRRFLTGGLATVPVAITTLANRPALAGGYCTVSAVLSGNLSRQITEPCGVSPGCWKNHALENNASSWTVAGFSPSQAFTSVFPMLNTPPWSCNPANATLLDGLNGGIVISVKLTDGSKAVTLSNFASGFTLQIVAAVLNAGFFGTPKYPLSVQDVQYAVIHAITKYPTDGSGATSNGNQSNIKTQISKLTDKLNGYNTVTPECPVV